MTSEASQSRDLKSTDEKRHSGRKTSYDVAHPRYEAKVRPPKEVRKATPAEMRANNTAMVETARNHFDLTARSKVGIIRQLFARAETFNGYKAVRAGMIGVTGNGVVLTA